MVKQKHKIDYKKLIFRKHRSLTRVQNSGYQKVLTKVLDLI